MFKRELKINFKTFVLWTTILLLMFLLVFLVYPSIMSNENAEMIEEMMKMFPKELLVSFNMDLSSIETVFGWIKTEGFVFVLLVTGCYSSVLGANILLKEENDKTIEYLNSLPIKRNNIIFSKVTSSLIYIILMVLLIAIFNYIGLSLSGDFNKTQYVLLSITPLFSSLVFFFISLFISTFFHKTKKLIGISLGIVFVSYILNILSTLGEEVEFLKYFSIFTLADIRNVIKNIAINPIMIFISISISLMFLILTIIKYNKKELV